MSTNDCEFCGSPDTGPKFITPYGICRACACTRCNGFRQFDDRGLVYCNNWPSLYFTPCPRCNGAGTKEAATKTAPAEAP